MYTMQEILFEKLPHVLSIDPEEVSQETGPFSIDKCMTHINAANKELANMAGVRESRFLMADLDIVVPQSATEYRYEVELPYNLIHPTIMHAIDSEGRSLYWVKIKQAREVPDDFNNQQFRLLYEFFGSVLYLLKPRRDRYRLSYQRTPGTLAYGAVEDVSGSVVTLSEDPTGGQLDSGTNAYVGDSIMFTKEGEARVTRRISAYNPATRELTLTSEPTGVDDAWEYSFLSFLPSAHQDLLVYGAAMRFLEECQTPAAAAAGHFQRTLDPFLAACKPDDAASPFTIIQAMPGMSLGRPNGTSGYNYGFGSRS